MYAKAICTPIIACEFSAPNTAGVECIMPGYTGAHPSPTATNPAAVNANPKGIEMSATPQASIIYPARISVLSENLMVIKPFNALPKVMPIKNMLANIAA